MQRIARAKERRVGENRAPLVFQNEGQYALTGSGITRWVFILHANEATQPLKQVTIHKTKTPLTMRRSGTPLAFLAISLFVAGCAGYTYEAGVAYQTVHHTPRYESRLYHRVDQDARRYTRHLDHYLHLSRRQERRIYRLLKDRAYALLDRTPRAEHYRIYPFPREYGHSTHRITRRWWHETDRRIEGQLKRRQVREYRALTHRDYYDDGYDRRPKRYDDDDGYYEHDDDDDD